MAIEKLEYPATGPVTNSFEPTREADFGGSDERIDLGIVAELSSGAQQYRYSEGIQTKYYRRTFRALPLADKTAFLAFLAAVLGDEFKFTDFAGGTHTVAFDSYAVTFTPEEGNLWTWEIVLREEL
jgi:hypothetical protein